jgi:hypothetical protein
MTPFEGENTPPDHFAPWAKLVSPIILMAEVVDVAGSITSTLIALQGMPYILDVVVENTPP